MAMLRNDDDLRALQHASPWTRREEPSLSEWAKHENRRSRATDLWAGALVLLLLVVWILVGVVAVVDLASIAWSRFAS